MTADEVLKQMQNSIYKQSNEQVYCAINPETRTIEIPDEYSLLGVESDEKSERVWFQCPKIVGDNIDLSQLQIRVNYQNANSQKDQYIVTDVQSEGDNIIFSWLLSRKVTAYRGSVSFIVCAVKVSGETIQNEWNTTLATAQVLQGLEVDDPEITEEESDVIAQLLQIMTDTSEQAVADVGTAKTSALEEIGTSKTDALSAISQQKSDSVSAVQSAQSAALSAVENAGELIKESLPSDYTELSNKVDELDRTKAPAITESTSGESIQLSDSGDAPLTDIKLYGKSKQDGEPSPDNPVEIEIPGSDGNVVIESVGENLFDNDSKDIEQGAFGSNSGLPNVNIANRVRVINMTHVQPGEYTINIENTDGKQKQVNVWVYNLDGTFLKNENIGTYQNSPVTFTITGNRNIRFGVSNADQSNITPSDVGDIMLNKGSSALPYEPYKRTSATLPTPNGIPGIPVTSAGNYTDAGGQRWVCDEIDYARGKYVQRVNKLNVNDFSKTNISTGGTGSRFFSHRLDRIKESKKRVVCNYFVFSDTKSSYNDTGNYIATDEKGNLGIYIRVKDDLSNEQFKQKFPDLVVYYMLETPVETDLTTEQLTALKQLRTYQTVTNITTDSEPQVGMEVEYTADTKTYIDNKFAELAQSLAATQNTLLQEV